MSEVPSIDVLKILGEMVIKLPREKRLVMMMETFNLMAEVSGIEIQVLTMRLKK